MIIEREWGFADSGPVRAFALSGAAGCTLEIMSLGASVTGLNAPDREGRLANIILGLDDVQAYAASDSYFGATVGRFANRIAGGRVVLDGRMVQLDRNDGDNMLHGGRDGFHRRNWSVAPYDPEGCEITFTLTSPDGDMGFPGALEAQARYGLLPGGGFSVEYVARCDAPCPVNIANHAYFNLAGEGGGPIDDHLFRIDADHFLPVGDGLIPTGVQAPVAGTVFDFRLERKMGDALSQNDPQFAFAGGIDHNFCLRPGDGLRLAAVVAHPPSGRRLTVRATAPGLQVYTGNFLDGSEGRGGLRHVWRSGFCLEAQGFPNAPNQPGFPNAILRPGETWRSYTEYAMDRV